MYTVADRIKEDEKREKREKKEKKFARRHSKLFLFRSFMRDSGGFKHFLGEVKRMPNPDWKGENSAIRSA